MAFYSKAHFARLSNGGRDTPEIIRERIRYREACEQAHVEMMERFAPLTAQNARAAVEWQETRIRELTGR